MLWLKCVRWPMLLALDVIVVVPIASFDCWFGLFLPEPGDIFSASVSNELSMFSVSFLWWIIWFEMNSIWYMYIYFRFDIVARTKFSVENFRRLCVSFLRNIFSLTLLSIIYLCCQYSQMALIFVWYEIFLTQ